MKNKASNLFRWVFALPIAIAAMCLVQVILSLIIKIFAILDQFQFFKLFPVDVNYFLINFGATYAFLKVFNYCVPKYKFKATLILTGIYLLAVCIVFLLLIIGQKFSADFPFERALNENLGIFLGCVVTVLLLNQEKESNSMLKDSSELPKGTSNNMLPKPPYQVVLVDQFNGHCEDGYENLNKYDSLKEAIDAAKRITADGIKDAGSVEKWFGMGEAGLVYDAQGLLIWDGIEEFNKGRV